MNRRVCGLVLGFGLLFCPPGNAQIIYVTNSVLVQTFAGSGAQMTVDGLGTNASFALPNAIAADSLGNLLVLDTLLAEEANVIRGITPAGKVTTLAGGGQQLPGYGTNVTLSANASVTIDHSNNLWIASSYGTLTCVRHGDSYVFDVTPPLANGHTPLVTGPGALCVDSLNNLYYSIQNQIWRRLSTGAFEVFAGSTNTGTNDGNGTNALFNLPGALAADAADNIWVWDSHNYLIRRIKQNKDVVTVTGNGQAIDWDGPANVASFAGMDSMCADSAGNILLGCGAAGRIRIITPSTNVMTLAGGGTSGYQDGTGAQAEFGGRLIQDSLSVCTAYGMLFVADEGNRRIRSIMYNASAVEVPAASLSLALYPGLQITGLVGRAYQVQTSSDLTNWNPATTVVLSASPQLWFDTNSIGKHKFYRAYLLP